MKKLILIFIFLTSINLNAQCEFNLKELTMSIFYNSSAFDDYVLKNGFTLNTTNDLYECNSQKLKYDFIKKEFFNNNNSIKMIYVTFSETSYLKIKEQIYLSNYKFIQEEKTENSKSFIFKLGELTLTITTKTHNNNINSYEFLFIYDK
jgi:hypothetical protein